MKLLSSRPSRRVLIVAALYIIASLLCTQIPLLNYLGYEFSTFIAVLGSALTGFFTIAFVKDASDGANGAEPGSLPRPARAFRDSLVLNLLLLAIPAVMMLANALIVKNCSIIEGLGFFILIPVVSVCFASSLGFFCAVRYRFAKTAFSLFFFLSVLYAVTLGYYTPAIFSYNFFYGYFPGFSYDEVISLNKTLLFFRLLTLLLGVVLAWMAVLLLEHASGAEGAVRKRIMLLRLLFRPGRRVAASTITLFLVVVYLYRCPLGFESTRTYIQDVLGAKFETEHFVIYYAKSSYTDEEIRWVGAEHEFRLQQILDVLALRSHSKLTSYVYPSADVKHRLVGAGITNIAKPWSGQIHITKQSLDATLKHELVHIVAAPFGAPVINASLIAGLVEGLAMAIEQDWGHRTLHQYATGMKKFGLAPDIHRLMTPLGFVAQSSSVSYVMAGSFCRYLIDRFGIRKMMLLYRNGDYTSVYGRSLDELVVDWQKFLDRIPMEEHDRDCIDVLFRSPAIFRKTCARVLAEKNAMARKAFEEKKYEQAENLFRESYSEGKGYEALSGYLVSALRRGEYAVLTSALDTIVTTDPHPAQFLPLFISIGDAAWASGEVEKAAALYQRLQSADISEGLTESAIVRSAALNNSAVRPGLQQYFLADVPDSDRAKLLDSLLQTLPGNPLFLYLRGKVLHRMERFDESLEVLAALDMSTVDRRLNATRLKMIGTSLFRLKRFQDAKASFWISLNYVTGNGERHEVEDWVERCDWMTGHPLP